MLIDADASEGIPRELSKFTKLEEDTSNSSGVTRNSGDVVLITTSEVEFTDRESISIGGVSGNLDIELVLNYTLKMLQEHFHPPELLLVVQVD